MLGQVGPFGQKRILLLKFKLPEMESETNLTIWTSTFSLCKPSSFY